MLPFVCSASPSCSSQFPISFPIGSRKISLLWRSEEKCIREDKGFLSSQSGIHKHEIFFKPPHSTGSSHSLIMEPQECPSSTDSSILSPYPNYFDDIVRGFSNENSNSLPEKWNCYAKQIDASYSLEADLNRSENDFPFDSVDVIASKGDKTVIPEPPIPQNVEAQSGDVLTNFENSSGEVSNFLAEPSLSASLSVPDSTSTTTPETFEVPKDEIASLKGNVGDLLGGIQDSTTASVSNAQKAVEDTYEAIVSSIKKTAANGADSVDNIINGFVSSLGKSKEQTNDKLAAVSSNLKGNLYEAGGVAANVLRKAITSFESFLSKGTTNVVYSYGSVKSFLPTDIQETITTAEGKFLQVINPIGTAVQKVYILIEGLERNLGIDPNDPLVHFILIFAGSATLGVSYWLLLYGGYSGNLSPQSTFELLSKEENAVLVDIRPEDLREREGVPDLRRRARFKYASVSLPEVDGSVRKLLNSAAEVDAVLIASIIRNLKIVKDGTKVIVLDARGDESKGIARSLRKLGIKKSYMVEGGFRSWVQSSLRIKELKPETALDIINEEAEAIIEEIKPTPALIFGYGLGAVATLYALLEWEKTLQLIGVIGVVQSLYGRISSYESSEDLKADVRLLLTPVTMGAQVISRAAGNSDPNQIGLPTSPSSTAVQNRVIQAAAKHESQPSDPDEPQISKSDGLDLSEA